jgi:hypothetical protein
MPRRLLLSGGAVFVIAALLLLWRPPWAEEPGERAIPWLQPVPSLTGDEPGHLRCAITFTRLFFVERDFDSELWADPMMNYGRFEPRMTHYTLGGLFFGTMRAGGPLLRIRGDCGGNLHSPCGQRAHHQLHKAAVGLLAAACVVMLFCLAGAEVGPIGGLAAAALLLLHPLFRLVAASLVREVPILLYSLLTFLLLQPVLRALPERLPVLRCALVGLAAGTAVSCGLYAFPVYPAVAVALLARGWRSPLRSGAAFLIAVGVGVAVFFATNPLLWHDLQGGLHSLTSGHLEADAGSATIRQWQLLPWLATYPFLVFRSEPFDLWNNLPQLGGPALWTVGLGWALGLWALTGLRRGRGVLPAAWLLASAALTGFVVIARPAEFLSAKLFVLPAAALVWLVGLQLGATAHALYARWTKRG